MIVNIADNKKTAGFFNAISKAYSFTPTGMIIDKTGKLISPNQGPSPKEMLLTKAPPEAVAQQIDKNIFVQGPDAFKNSGSYPLALLWSQKKGIPENLNELWHALYFQKDTLNFVNSAAAYAANVDPAAAEAYKKEIKRILSKYFNQGEILQILNTLPYLNLEAWVTTFYPEWSGEWLHSALIIKDFNRFLNNVVTYAETLENPKAVKDYAKTIKGWIKKYYSNKKWEEKIEDQEMIERLGNTLFLEEKEKQIQAAREAADLEYQQKKANQKKIIMYAVAALGGLIGLKKLMGK